MALRHAHSRSIHGGRPEAPRVRGGTAVTRERKSSALARCPSWPRCDRSRGIRPSSVGRRRSRLPTQPPGGDREVADSSSQAVTTRLRRATGCASRRSELCLNGASPRATAVRRDWRYRREKGMSALTRLLLGPKPAAGNECTARSPTAVTRAGMESQPSSGHPRPRADAASTGRTSTTEALT